MENVQRKGFSFLRYIALFLMFYYFSAQYESITSLEFTPAKLFLIYWIADFIKFIFHLIFVKFFTEKKEKSGMVLPFDHFIYNSIFFLLICTFELFFMLFPFFVFYFLVQNHFYWAEAHPILKVVFIIFILTYSFYLMNYFTAFKRYLSSHAE